MSNLNTSVKFDVTRGWPDGGAIAENFEVEAAAVVTEGLLVSHDMTGGAGGLNTPTGGNQNNPAVAGAASVVGGLYMVISGNDQTDAQVGVAGGQPAGVADIKITVLRGDFTVVTEKVEPGSALIQTPEPAGTPVSYNVNGMIDDVAQGGTDYLTIGYIEKAWDGESLTVALSL